MAIAERELTTLTPAELDAVWFRLDERIYNLTGQIVSVTERLSGKELNSYQLNLVANLRQEKANLMEQRQPYQAEWTRRQGWTRYLKVEGDGHVHSSRSCPTCFPTTVWMRVASLSGLTEHEMVEAVGDRACTVCYPWAPALPSYRPVESPERQARREDRERKAAEKAAKAITAADGGKLLDDSGYPIATLVTARRELLHTLENQEYARSAHPDSIAAQQVRDGFYEAVVARIADAIAAKTGEDREQLLADARAKAAKKARS